MHQIKYNFLSIVDIFNIGRLKFSDLHPIATPDTPGMLVMERSNLGEMDVFNVDFNAHDDIRIQDCYLIYATFVNINWPKAFYGHSFETTQYDLQNIK